MPRDSVARRRAVWRAAVRSCRRAFNSMFLAGGIRPNLTGRSKEGKGLRDVQAAWRSRRQAASPSSSTHLRRLLRSIDAAGLVVVDRPHRRLGAEVVEILFEFLFAAVVFDLFLDLPLGIFERGLPARFPLHHTNDMKAVFGFDDLAERVERQTET